MLPLPELSFLITVVLMLIGGAVFSVASMFSGRSVFREWEWSKAVFATIAAAVLLLAISPLGFIVLTPNDARSTSEAVTHRGITHWLIGLVDGEDDAQESEDDEPHGEAAPERDSSFGVDITPTVAADETTVELAFRPTEPAKARYEFSHTVHLVLGHGLMPFLLAAFGLGLIYGTYSQLNLRWMLWRRARHKRGLKLPLLSYQSLSSSFFGKLKHGALIEVGIRGGAASDLPEQKSEKETIEQRRVRRVVGQLDAFSSGEQGAKFILRNPLELKEEDTKFNFEVLNENWKPDDGMQLFMNDSQFEYVRIPPASHQIHGEPINHLAQSYLMAMTAIGFGLFSWASYLSGEFFVTGLQSGLTAAYRLLAGIFFLVCLGFTGFSFWVLRQDFAKPTRWGEVRSNVSTVAPRVWTAWVCAASFIAAAVIFVGLRLAFGGSASAQRGEATVVVALVGFAAALLIVTLFSSNSRDLPGHAIASALLMGASVIVVVVGLVVWDVNDAKWDDVSRMSMIGAAIAAGVFGGWVLAWNGSQQKRKAVKDCFRQIVRDAEREGVNPRPSEIPKDGVSDGENQGDRRSEGEPSIAQDSTDTRPGNSDTPQNSEEEPRAFEAWSRNAEVSHQKRVNARLGLMRSALKLYLRQDLNKFPFYLDELPSDVKEAGFDVNHAKNLINGEDYEDFLLYRLLHVVQECNLQGATPQVIEWFADYLRITYTAHGHGHEREQPETSAEAP